jgi:hypothetical protein
MTLLGRTGVAYPAIALPSVDVVALRDQKVAQKSDGSLLRDAILLSGVPDPTRGIGALTDGITFTSGQSITLQHHLGRKAIGFLVTDAQLSAASLVNITSTLSTDVQKTSIRLQHTGGSTTRVKLLVF